MSLPKSGPKTLPCPFCDGTGGGGNDIHRTDEPPWQPPTDPCDICGGWGTLPVLDLPMDNADSPDITGGPNA